MGSLVDEEPFRVTPFPLRRESGAWSHQTGELEQLRRLLDSAEVRVALYGADRRFRYANRSYCEFVGIPQDDLIGRTTREVLGDALYRDLKPLADMALSGTAAQLEQWVDYPGRGRRYVRRVYTPNHLPDGRQDGYAVFIHDITEHHLAENERRASEALKAAVVNGALDGVVAIDTDERIVEFNPAAERIFGYSRAEVLGRKACEVILPPEQRTPDAGGLSRFLESGEAGLLGNRVEVEAERADGWRIPVELTVTETTASGRRLFTAAVRDISDRKRLERELIDLAYRDQETGLANRQSLLRILAEARAAGRAVTLLSIDIDRFDNLRNSFGHEFASDALAGLAARLMGGFASAARLARIADHTLGLLFDPAPDEAVLSVHLARIRALLRRTRAGDGGSVPLSASIGIAGTKAGAWTTDDLLRDAEIAASHARSLGGGRAVHFETGMREQLVWTTRIEHDLRDALMRGEGLSLVYQPIVDLAGGGLRGFEALLRWTHPERGAISPVEFIPVAESTGLIVTLGRWVLERACRQLAEWRALCGPGTPAPFMSVNLSPVQLAEPSLVDEVRRVLDETGVPAHLLKLEVTEGAVMARAEQGIATLKDLRDLGVHIAIDDFGTGYSSLSYLTRLPADSLKVDRSFLQDLHHSVQGDAILRAIITVAHTCGFDVVAEGVETAPVADHLRQLACDYAQGYFFARPMPPEDAGAWLRRGCPETEQA
ncbi:MAG TPA: EAL domain-containing protein [Azospirillum sp.]